ncbi:MAG: TonB-dependent receptor [Candidatus Marinimicrobia bacterium]|jgi:outer membrane receptor protein involved in Fe transport|nr:TonB-dependent receptor [Candidatus Neomarinimicrobiota bacterium]MBT3692221.1 TonB-dependent receptor [Candidatus Neomarinimicrobiota bacterium]MBT3731772.1 TonB-dependent receptor [Candidatus Neomarinimicrobiota bacterium]MBT4176750.1 TonB-dependent receptor [Candidatus Neomarinimicrobiota bacterium]MBT4594144.1 TonB-dependent receptor [Candidatus Neomarinimicrobiota bacterium]
MFKKIIILSIVLSASLLFAQGHSGRRGGGMPAIGKISGVVADSLTDEFIPYASISVINLKTDEIVTGGITDESGYFNITGISFGRFKVRVEFIGYAPREIGPIKLFPGGGTMEPFLGRILLEQKSLKMDDVTVIADKPIFTHSVDKKVFNVEQNTTTTGGNAIDVLRQVPGVEVDMNGKVSLRGNTNVNLLIDGKSTRMSAANEEALLENILADNIKDVEVITNPGAKYDPDGMAGILNIVLKENRLAGLNGGFSLGTDFGVRNNASGQVNYKNKHFNLFSNVGVKARVRNRTGDNEQFMTLNDTITYLNEITTNDRNGSNLFFKSGMEYTPNRFHTFGFDMSYNDGGGKGDSRVDSDHRVDDILSKYYRETTGTGFRDGLDFTLNYDRKFQDPRHNLTFLASQSQGKDDHDNSFEMFLESGDPDILDFSPQKTARLNKNYSSLFQADYVLPLEEWKIEAGFKSTGREMDDDFVSESQISGEWSDYDSLTNQFIYNEKINAVYTQISLNKGMAQGQFGLRYEMAEAHSELVTTDSTYDNPYNSFFPSASISFGPAGIFQIQASYSKRINRPSSRRLNPFPNYSNKMNMRMGNPFLRPEYIDSYELNFSKMSRKLSITAGLYYRHMVDKIRHHKFVRDDGVGVTTYVNFDNTKTFGSELVLSGQLVKGLRVMLSGNAYVDAFDASSLNMAEYDADAIGLSGRAMIMWNLSQNTELMLMTFYRAPMDIPLGRMNAMSFTTFSIKQSFMDKRMSLALKVNDPLDVQGFSFEVGEAHWNQSGLWRWDSRYATLNWDYRFGKMEQSSRRGKRGGSEREDMDMGF